MLTVFTLQGQMGKICEHRVLLEYKGQKGTNALSVLLQHGWSRVTVSSEVRLRFIDHGVHSFCMLVFAVGSVLLHVLLSHQMFNCLPTDFQTSQWIQHISNCGYTIYCIFLNICNFCAVKSQISHSLDSVSVTCCL